MGIIRILKKILCGSRVKMWTDSSETFITEEYRKKYPNKRSIITNYGIRRIYTKREWCEQIEKMLNLTNNSINNMKTLGQNK